MDYLTNRLYKFVLSVFNSDKIVINSFFYIQFHLLEQYILIEEIAILSPFEAEMKRILQGLIFV